MEKLKKRMVAVLVVGILMMPVLSIAGDLEPSGPPAPTMKTLDEINISWHQKLSQGRFKSVLDGFGVLDKETNLVWQQNRTNNQYTWFQAINACYTATYGGRYGWRLPTVEEIFTLFDPNAVGYPWLPEWHLFGGQVAGNYWTMNTDPSNPNNAYYVGNASDTNPPYFYSASKSTEVQIWCVRGGHGYDGR
jgi:hypothetical protein